MENPPLQIVPYHDATHREEVEQLWRSIFAYQAPHNAPQVVIDEKLKHKDDLFFVTLERGKVVGTVMAGYDGHRGWIYSIAVSPQRRRRGIASALLDHAIGKLKQLGCLKVNLQIIEDNESTQKFYLANGFSPEPRISMGKKLY